MSQESQKPALVMIGSGQGSTIDFFCGEIQSGRLSARAAALVTDRPRAGLRSVAERRGVRLIIADKSRPGGLDSALCQILVPLRPRLILLAGFLRKIGPRVLSRFEGRIINSHPSLIPRFSGRGMYGRRVHQAVIEAGEKETGASIHLVNESYDEGRILAQEKTPVLPGDTAASLERRLKAREKELYLRTVQGILSGQIPLPEARFMEGG